MILQLSLLLLVLSANASGKAPTAEKPPTFNRDIAPIVFTHCVECHHPSGTAPFSLTTYADVKKRAKLIAHVTANRYMPPWMPEPGHGDFLGERRLSDEQIALIDRWWKAGAPQGVTADLKSKPQWSNDWQLGKPDLVVTLPEPYTLPADGRDVYRNFIIPNVVTTNRYLRAVEFRPGGSAAIHHAFVLLDDTGAARRRAAAETEPGFPGMDAAGAVAPDAMFMGWQPGKRASEAPTGLAAFLGKNSDLVLQLHMRPTGKPEKIEPSVALYFTDQPPPRSAFILLLRSVDIDIPAGATDFSIESSYKVPVDVDVLSILPHLHYLGKEVRGWAELPDGTRRELIFIKQWDFNWQGDYRFAEPVSLPKGSTLRMRFTYDNSANNERNPNQPPQRVTYGLQSSDEMGELWFQLLPKNPADLDLLSRDCTKNHALPDAIAWAKAMLRINPKDAESRAKLGAALAVVGRTAEAVQELEKAVADNPNMARAHYILGQIFSQQENAPKAKVALEHAVQLDPENANAHNDLGWLLLVTGNIPEAVGHFEKAVQLNPTDPLARQNLQKARTMMQKR